MSCAAEPVSAGGGAAGLALVWAMVCALVLVQPSAASAGWPLAGAQRVVLGFGAAYSVGVGDSSQHRGVDIEGSAGERVLAPVSGRVSFAGSVPGVGGGRVVAVTIETALGKVTLLPLERVAVTRGEQVSDGAEIGALAESGDGSSAGTHLHVGVRRADLYVDPLGLIAPPPSAPNEGADARVGAPAGAPVGAPTAADVRAGARLPEGVILARTAGTCAAVTGRAKATAGGELSPGVSIAVRGTAPQGEAAAGSGLAPVVLTEGQTAAAAGTPQATVLTRDGVVAAVSTAATSQHAAGPTWIALSVARVQAAAERCARVASLVLLGVMAALGALWPLWRGTGRKASGKVPVSPLHEDVAAAPSR